MDVWKVGHDLDQSMKVSVLNVIDCTKTVTQHFLYMYLSYPTHHLYRVDIYPADQKYIADIYLPMSYRVSRVGN